MVRWRCVPPIQSDCEAAASVIVTSLQPAQADRASNARLRLITSCHPPDTEHSARIHAGAPRTCARNLNPVGALPEPPMTPIQDATQRPPKYPADLETSLILPKQRASTASSLAALPYRTSNPSLQKLFESTASISTSRPSSGSATPTASVIPGSVFSPGSRQNGTGTPGNLPPGVSDEHKTLIQKAFAPHVVVVADNETEELIRGKGLEGGLLQLLRPFGESVPGKVTIRDSVGSSKSFEDFGVRFVGINESSSSTPPRRIGGDVTQVEDLVDRHLQYSEFNGHSTVPDYLNQGEVGPQDSSRSPFYTLYLRRLLSGQPMVPHETFAHPVVGVIVTSSRSADPVEQLRELYNRQLQGDLLFPQWVDNQFLRYYVFIHEEETGDIAKSTTTFDSMKRHFGLNCHLLRLKGQQCISSDDDAVRLPTCEWMSASEELAEIQKRGTTISSTDYAPRTNSVLQKLPTILQIPRPIYRSPMSQP